MTIYYVRKSGNDSNDGLSPAGAWLTIGKALGAAGISSGDTVYIGAGVYREKITCNLTSPTVETFVIGDCDGSHTGDSGEIRITNYLTDDKTAPADTAPVLFNLNGRAYLTFQRITFQAGYSGSADSLAMIYSYPDTVNHITFYECTFSCFTVSQSNSCIYLVSDVDTPMNLLVDRCYFVGCGNSAIELYAPKSTTDDCDLNVVVRNCVGISSGFYDFVIVQRSGGTGNGWPGGVHVLNCTLFGIWQAALATTSTSTTIPCTIYNCLLAGGGNSVLVNAASADQIVEDYNIAAVSSQGYNTPTGGHTIIGVSYAFLLHFGQELQQGLMLRPFMMPTADSPILGFGDNGDAPSVDAFNRPRPAGGQSISKAVGAYERHDTGVKEVTVVDSSPASVKIIGPGDHDLYIPVDAASTTISIKARYDTNHAATNKPQVILLSAPEIGVTAETKTMTAAANTWETLTFAAQTPTAKGVIKLRLVSRSAAGNGIAYFDTVSIA